MSYNDPQPIAKRKTGPRPKGRAKWNLTWEPAVKSWIESAAERQGKTPSDFLNDHFRPLITSQATPEQPTTEKQPEQSQTVVLHIIQHHRAGDLANYEFKFATPAGPDFSSSNYSTLTDAEQVGAASIRAIKTYASAEIKTEYHGITA